MGSTPTATSGGRQAKQLRLEPVFDRQSYIRPVCAKLTCIKDCLNLPGLAAKLGLTSPTATLARQPAAGAAGLPGPSCPPTGRPPRPSRVRVCSSERPLLADARHGAADCEGARAQAREDALRLQGLYAARDLTSVSRLAPRAADEGDGLRMIVQKRATFS